MWECCTQELSRKFNLEVLYMEIEQGVSSGGVAYRDGTESLTWKCYIEMDRKINLEVLYREMDGKINLEVLHTEIE